MDSRDYAAFHCPDCGRLMPSAEAAYDIPSVGELEGGVRCQDCARDFDELARQWPGREVA